MGFPATTELTGNHYLTFPRIEREDASMASVSALHAGLGGTIAWEGDPLMRISVGRAGARAEPLRNLRWQRLDRWIPQCEADIEPGSRLEVTICAPGGYEPLARGGFITCALHNRSRQESDYNLVLDIRMRSASLHVVRPRRIDARCRGTGGAMHRGAALEIGDTATAALGFVADDDATYEIVDASGSAQPIDADTEAFAASGESLHLRVRMQVSVRAGKTARRTFHIGIGRDRDSAIGHAAHLTRVGAATLLREARLELAHLARRTGDVQQSELINRNLLFNHYFGLARGLDDDRLYAVSSRSPDHVPGAAVNEREMLFWTLPCITLTDPLLARELLRDAFEVYSAQPGLPWRYLDGGVIEPGFCLEQALLYPLALDRYVRETGDESILDDPLIQDVLREIDAGLESHLHEDVLLCDTEMLPGGEIADQPYPTLGNAMLRAYAAALPRIWRAVEGDPPASFDGAADDIASAVWQRCMAGLRGSQVFVSTTDLENRSAVYDDPSLSLGLLSFFEFCRDDDTTLRDTLSLLRSDRYPFWRDGVAPGLASRAHPDDASVAALCTDLLGARRDEAMRTLRALELHDGIASDRYDPKSGRTSAGRHAAALAGLLAWSLIRAIDGPTRPANTSNERKKQK